MVKHRFSLVACARWEEQHIQEWIEYHKAVGFDHVYLYSNDDDPDALFRAVAPYAYGSAPFVTFRHWREVGDQVGMYFHFLENFGSETEWFSFLDVDEFFVFRDLDNVAAFMRGYQDTADCLYFNWLVHGHNGKLRRERGDTLTNHPRRAARVDYHTKMLCRSSAIDPALVRDGYVAGRGAFHHWLDKYRLPGVRCADVLHEPTDGYSADVPASARRFAERPGYSETVIERAYVAHFQFRSEEDFIRRWQRGGFDNSEYWKRIHEIGAHRAILEPTNAVYDSYLAAYWHRHTAPTRRFGVEPPYGAPRFENVALNKPSFQSSVYQPAGAEPAGSRVSGGGNNGVRTGTYGFHTACESQPWWCVDLLAPHRIAEIHVYNRRDQEVVIGRAAALEILGSADTETWTTLFARGAGEPFGADGTPLVVPVAGEAAWRFILLRLPGRDYFHLDEVEVYGEPAAPV
ncbi:MAG TPA: glycosyltransferase family 2 protein [Acetobacteraceae bacterium]|nr:glycosyltransferase family 2 protein [Acetobacteraceae bacterium]